MYCLRCAFISTPNTLPEPRLRTTIALRNSHARTRKNAERIRSAERISFSNDKVMGNIYSIYALRGTCFEEGACLVLVNSDPQCRRRVCRQAGQSLTDYMYMSMTRVFALRPRKGVDWLKLTKRRAQLDVLAVMIVAAMVLISATD